MFREPEGALHQRARAQGRAVGLRPAPAQAIRLGLRRPKNLSESLQRFDVKQTLEVLGQTAGLGNVPLRLIPRVQVTRVELFDLGRWH